jgi:Tfp pilus assembly protein PilX
MNASHRSSPRVALRHHGEAGSILITTLIVVTVLALIAAAAIYRLNNRHATTYLSQSWNEALTSSESGVDAALAALNSSTSSPSTAWTGWKQADGTASDGTNATTFPKTRAYGMWTHNGEGNNQVFAIVQVDNAVTDGSGSKWMRVRSTGVTEVPRMGLAGLEGSILDSSGLKRHGGALRKVRLTKDLTAGALRMPQLARTIEVMACPPGSGLYIRGLTVKNWIGMSGSAYTDSFDSGDASKSTNGLYDVTKRQQHGDVAVNTTGDNSDLRNTFVWGNASSNGGTIADTTNVKGSVFNNFSTTINPVKTPNLGIINVTPSVINNPSSPVTLTGGPAGAPQNYKLTALTISNSSNPLILAPSAPGVESYINIWVTGKTTVSGSGYVIQQPGVHVKIYSEDEITVSGGGIMNQTNVAANLEILGVDPASGGTNKATVSGSANFIGVLNAPQFAITISGTGSYSGAAIGLNATISGSGGFHYDEALSRLGGTGNFSYQVASWVEDIR